MANVTVFVPKGKIDIVLKKYTLNNSVKIVEADDVDDVVIIGPFGVIKSGEEARIILNQLSKQ